MATRGFTPSHPYAELFPLHDEGKPFEDFVADIKQNGLTEKIVMYRDQVLDGRRRERACRRAGVEPKYSEFKGNDDQAFAFAISKNLHRRHLGDGERAIVAGRIATAKDGRPKTPAICGSIEKPLSVPEAAKTMGVSDAAAERGKKVVMNGTPELQEAVIDGTLSVSDAAKVAGESPKTQNKAIEDVKKGKATTAKKAVDAKKTESEPKKISGSPKFDEKKFDKVYGPLVRLVDERAKAMGKGKGHKLCQDKLGEFLDAYKAWKKETA